MPVEAGADPPVENSGAFLGFDLVCRRRRSVPAPCGTTGLGHAADYGGGHFVTQRSRKKLRRWRSDCDRPGPCTGGVPARCIKDRANRPWRYTRGISCRREPWRPGGGLLEYPARHSLGEAQVTSRSCRSMRRPLWIRRVEVDQRPHPSNTVLRPEGAGGQWRRRDNSSDGHLRPRPSLMCTCLSCRLVMHAPAGAHVHEIAERVVPVDRDGLRWRRSAVPGPARGHGAHAAVPATTCPHRMEHNVCTHVQSKLRWKRMAPPHATTVGPARSTVTSPGPAFCAVAPAGGLRLLP